MCQLKDGRRDDVLRGRLRVCCLLVCRLDGFGFYELSLVARSGRRRLVLLLIEEVLRFRHAQLVGRVDLESYTGVKLSGFFSRHLCES